ncbi:MAG: hypothetical protein K8U03_09710 [Planctomycetia bacterium]|nr:hypothetical protein [Planctomycetia bacterium]
MSVVGTLIFRSGSGNGAEPPAVPARPTLFGALPSFKAPAEVPAETVPPVAETDPFPFPPGFSAEELVKQTVEKAADKSMGCIQCHHGVGDMHAKATVHLGCTDCHGGDASATTKERGHVGARFPEAWPTAGNPVRSYALLNHESPEFIRFVNPGDLRVAHISCGACHAQEVLAVRKSMMTHGCMLWGAALYNNGAVPNKRAVYGESYSMCGSPQRLQTVPPPTQEEIEKKGVLPYLEPLPRFEISQPGNVLRIFERGGRFRLDTGIPEPLEVPGKPRARLSNRGLGTENRTDPTFLGLQKTRLLDPTLNFLGTNDHPGDFRSSGCSACHVPYANDRSPVNSGPYAMFGNMGRTATPDPTISPSESGHPIMHRFAPGNSIPTSQCIVCHIHPGTTVLNSFTGYQWWDEETDGELMYPKVGKQLTSQQLSESQMSNPDEAAARGLWSNPDFLANVTDLNTQTRHTQFADYHGHGWVFRAVFKKDRSGRILDHRGEVLPEPTNEMLRAAIAVPELSRKQYAIDETKAPPPQRDNIPVHLLDIHLEKGMHCVDCHFEQDSHGNTKLYGEVRAAVEIQCEDCHGTMDRRPFQKLEGDKLVDSFLRTSGPASDTSSVEGGRNLELMRTPNGRKRFEREGNKVFQNSMVETNLRWEIVQTIDTIDTKSEHYNPRSHHAKTVRTFDDSAPDAAEGDAKIKWGGMPRENQCAHQSKKMSCIACHSSWNTSCFGCHLPQKANKKLPSLHNEGDVSRNIVSYNFQTLRDDVFMLAHDGDVTGNRIGPVRSSCAVHVGSYNNNRESIYVQQQTISSDGMSGIAFSTNVPHTVRGGNTPPKDPAALAEWLANYKPGTNETKMCSDCHVSNKNDNNAIMAQLLMQGTNYVNFIGRYCWVAAGEEGFHGVVATENDEPQAVLGSHLQSLAFPERFQQHQARGKLLEHGHRHSARDVSDTLLHPLRQEEVLNLQARGEYLYAACGEGGLRIFDIAFVDDKGFSQRVSSAPVSPVGQRFFVNTKFATAVAAPTTIAPDPTRNQDPANREPKVHGLYANIYVADRYEGLIVVGAGTLLDGNPLNNFVKREATFNPHGILNGARSITIVGTYAYLCCDAGLVVVSLADPKCPQIETVLGSAVFDEPRAMQAQFRYGFVCDRRGITVLDMTDLAHPVPRAMLPLRDARNIYLARTYAYIAAGAQGLVIVDITNPEAAFIDQVFDAGGCINDLNDVKLGITYVSEFAYLADGHNGMRIVQLTSPETPGNDGFSPRPTPELIATYCLPRGGRALAISKGVDRDRAVDESGNQISVFGRVGAGPLSAVDQHRMYLHRNRLWSVSDDPFDPRHYDYLNFEALPPNPNAGPTSNRRREAGLPER